MPEIDRQVDTLSREYKSRLLDGKYRALFEKALWICYRYGVDLQSLDSHKLRNLLAKELEGLEEIHPYVALHRTLVNPDNNFDLETGNLSYGVYSLSEPSIKDLNGDDLLGYQGTNNFIADLNTQIAKALNGSGSVKVLSKNIRGGGFLCNLDLLVLDGDTDGALEVLRRKSKGVQDVAKNVLIQHLQARIDELTREANKEVMRAGVEINRELEIHTLNTRIHNLEEFLGRVRDGSKMVHIAFGERLLSAVHKDSEALFRAMMSAKYASRMAILRTQPGYIPEDAGEYERSNWQRFNYGHMLSTLLRMRAELEEVVLDSSGDILDEWKPFFKFNDGQLSMTREALLYYRAHRKEAFGDIRDFPGKNRETVDDRLAFFDRYYQVINVIDELKGFTAKNLPDFFVRVDEILSIIGHAQELIESASDDCEALIDLLQRAADQQEISMRDTGKRIMRTTRGALRELLVSSETEDVDLFLEDDKSVIEDELCSTEITENEDDAVDTTLKMEAVADSAMIVALFDFRGIGASHQLDLENAHIKLNTLMHGRGRLPLHSRAITDRVSNIGYDVVARPLVEAGDSVTQEIVATVDRMVEGVENCDCQCFVDASGGDELTLFIKGSDEGVKAAQTFLEGDSFRHLRKVFYEQTIELRPLLEEVTSVRRVVAEVRRPLARLVHVLAHAEAELEAVKAQEPKIDLRSLVA